MPNRTRKAGRRTKRGGAWHDALTKHTAALQRYALGGPGAVGNLSNTTRAIHARALAVAGPHMAKAHEAFKRGQVQAAVAYKTGAAQAGKHFSDAVQTFQPAKASSVPTSGGGRRHSKKGKRSHTRKRRRDFTTKKTSKVFNRRSHYQRKSVKGVKRLPYHKRK
jgi:hypothetical protein